MLIDDKIKALPIVKWLTSQRNSLGGFSSTQDTVEENNWGVFKLKF